MSVPQDLEEKQALRASKGNAARRASADPKALRESVVCKVSKAPKGSAGPLVRRGHKEFKASAALRVKQAQQARMA